MSYNFTHRHYKKPFKERFKNFLLVSKYKNKFDLWSLQSKIIIEKYTTFTFLLLNYNISEEKETYQNQTNT